MIKIFVAENIPSLNKGEMAILDGMIESFRTLGNVELSMLSARPEIDKSRYGSRIKIIGVGDHWLRNGGMNSSKCGKILASIRVLSQHILFIIFYKIFKDGALNLFRSAVWNEYLTANIIIKGHDGTFGVGGSMGGPLLYPLYLPFFAKILNKPSVLYAGSVPRSKRFRFIFENLYRLALNNMDLITLRETTSYKNLLAIGAKEKNVFVTADLAFLLKPVQLKRIKEIMAEEGIDDSSTLLIGMTITREIASKSTPELDADRSYHNHISMMGEFIDKIVNTHNAKFVFIPHCIGFGRNLDDRIAAEDIYNICNSKSNIKLITTEYDAQELKGLIGELDFFIGERVHSVINALSMKVPSICISFSDDKRLDMLKLIGQEDAICHVENLNLDQLVIKFNLMWSMKATIQKDLTERIKEIQNQSRRNGGLLKAIYMEKSK